MRHYYISLRGDKQGEYADIYASSIDSAHITAVKYFGVGKVFCVYTELQWERKLTSGMKYIGKIENEEEQKYLKRKKVIF